MRVVFVVFLCLCFQDLIILILTKFISLVEIYRHRKRAHQFTKGLVTLRVMIGYRGGRQVISQVNVLHTYNIRAITRIIASECKFKTLYLHSLGITLGPSDCTNVVRLTYSTFTCDNLSQPLTRFI